VQLTVPDIKNPRKTVLPREALWLIEIVSYCGSRRPGPSKKQDTAAVVGPASALHPVRNEFGERAATRVLVGKKSAGEASMAGWQAGQPRRAWQARSIDEPPTCRAPRPQGPNGHASLTPHTRHNNAQTGHAGSRSGDKVKAPELLRTP
jgi:hypothetical protein